MRSWASWTAKTAVLTLSAGLAAAAGGLSGVAVAAVGGSGAGSGHVAASVGIPGDVCTSAGALLGIADAPCPGITAGSVPPVGAAETRPPAVASGNAPAQGAGAGSGQSAAAAGRAAASQGSSQETAGQRTSGQGAARNSGQSLAAAVGQVIQRAVAPVTAVLGAGGSAPALTTGPAPPAGVTGAPSLNTGTDGAPAPETGRTPAYPPVARAGDTNVPAATQLAGLGALPGLADLPSAGPASTPARNGAPGGGIPMPGTAPISAPVNLCGVSLGVLGFPASPSAGSRARACTGINAQSSALSRTPRRGGGPVPRCSPRRVELRMCGLGV